MGSSESRLTAITKSSSCLSCCKVSCDSPCCQSVCGDTNHCIYNMDIHEYISDSDEDIDTGEFMSK